MKTIYLSLAVAATILASTFAQAAAQEQTKLLGQCQLTKVSVLKSKKFPQGSQAVNETVNFILTRAITVVDPGKEWAQYYDETYIKMARPDDSCTSLICENANTSAQSDFSVPNSPQVIQYKFKANDDRKLDVTISEPNYTDWLRLTYDYQKRVGRLESRSKINGWGFSVIQNDHFVYDLANCSFKAPLALEIKN